MAMIGKSNSAHVLEISNRVAVNSTADGITGVANNLANHQSSANLNAHQITNVFGLQSALNGKANTAHTHSVSDVSGLQSLLDSKADKSLVTQVITVITDVDFVNQTVTTANINVVDGIIIEIN